MAFRSAGAPVHVTNLSASGITGNAPAGYAAGDKLLAFFALDANADPVITFTGWTLLGSYLQFGTDVNQIHVYWRNATGSDNFTASCTGSYVQATLTIAAWTGRDTAAPTNFASSNGSATASPISVSATGVTALSGDDIAVYIDLDIMSGTDQWSFSTISGYTKGITDYNSGDWTSDSLQYRDNVSAGATGALTLTATQTSGSANATAGHFVIALPSSAAAAVLSAPAATPGSTTATVGCTTDQASGTFYAVVDTAANLSGVTAAQIKAGQKASGSAALASGNAAVSTTTPSVGVTGLTQGTLYSYAAVQNNANGDSNVITGTFTTALSTFYRDDGRATPVGKGRRIGSRWFSGI